MWPCCTFVLIQWHPGFNFYQFDVYPISFYRLFDESPDIQELFYSFKDLKNQDELVQSLEELDHVARVMNSFGNCIELLSDKSQFTDMVQRLGSVHEKIGIKPEHLNVRMYISNLLYKFKQRNLSCCECVLINGFHSNFWDVYKLAILTILIQRQ